MSDEITEVLFQRGTLFGLHIGRPTFQKKLRPTDVLLEGIDPEALYLGHKKLLPKEAQEKLVTLEGKARTALSSKSLEFPLSGGRFVFYAALPDVVKSLQDLKKEWDQEVRALIREYPDLKARQLQTLAEQCRTLREKALSQVAGEMRLVRERELDNWMDGQRIQNEELYPSVDLLPKKFYFEWRMFKISPLSGTEEMSTIDEQGLADAKKVLREDLQAWVHQAATDMHKILGETALNAKEQLEKHGRLNPRSLRPLFEAFETFKAVDFTGSSHFQRVVDEIRQRYGCVDLLGELDMNRTAAAVNDPIGSGQFRELLGTVANLASTKIAETAGRNAVKSSGAFDRVLDL